MSTAQFHFVDRDAAVALAKAVSGTLAPDAAQNFDNSIAALRAEIASAQALLEKTQSELDALALGGHVREHVKE